MALDPFRPRPAWRVPGRVRLARRLIHEALRGFTLGELTMVDPDGGEHRFGSAATGPCVRIDVHDERLYARLLRNPDVGLGEGFVAGEWTTGDLLLLQRVLVRNYAAMRLARRPSLVLRTGVIGALLAARQDRRRAHRNISHHYDLGNPFYERMLGPTMAYSCALFEHEGQGLDEAQAAKLERICRSLDLGPHDHLLDIGCGWGSLALHAAREHGARVTGVTISREQHVYTVDAVQAAGLEDLVQVQLCDYRDLEGTFSKVASVEMVEAIGWREYPTFFRSIDRLLEPGGLACVQAITCPEVQFEADRRGTNWIREYPFPGSMIPSVGALTAAMARASTLELLGVEQLGEHYARTLREWHDRWRAAVDAGAPSGPGAHFDLGWEYYLTSCEAYFRERWIRDAQLLFARPGTVQGGAGADRTVTPRTCAAPDAPSPSGPSRASCH